MYSVLFVHPLVTHFRHVDSYKLRMRTCGHYLAAMFALRQDLFINCISIIASIELATCIALSVCDARNRIQDRVRASIRFEAPDTFATWVSMLDRQRDRRDGARYDGIERRSKIAYSPVRSN